MDGRVIHVLKGFQQVGLAGPPDDGGGTEVPDIGMATTRAASAI
jgi:hypothetical protein